MLCSECSNVIKPVVVLDIDGTLGDYHAHFYKFACDYEARTLPPFYDGTMEMHEWWNMELEHYRMVKLAYRQGGMKRSMPIFPHAQGLVNRLRAMGAEIWITTTRPYLRLDNIDPDTRFWLERNFIEYDGLMYDEDKYLRLAERIDTNRVVAVLEDLPEQYDQAAEAFGDHVPLLRSGQHNLWAVPERYRRVTNLLEAMWEIEHMMDFWKSAVR